MNKCSDYFNPELLFAYNFDSPIITFGATINGHGQDTNPYEWVNEDLRKMFDHDAEGYNGGGDILSVEYFLNRQNRYLSPFFDRLVDYMINGQHLDKQAVAYKISLLIITKFLKKWNKLAEAVFGDYNPIENYNMKENRKTDFEEHTVTDSSETVTNKYSGFNTDQMKDVSKSETEGDIDTTKTDTGTSANNELTRSGNIGVTTSQQMIESSFELAKKNLLDLIYSDIDTILFIDYYC